MSGECKHPHFHIVTRPTPIRYNGEDVAVADLLCTQCKAESQSQNWRRNTYGKDRAEKMEAAIASERKAS